MKTRMKFSIHSQRMHLWFLLAVPMLFSAWFAAEPISAQSRVNTWSPPLNLFETTGRASEAEVIADPSGAVHAVWAYSAPESSEAGEGQAIYYARRDGETWSEPVDVLMSPGGRVARLHAVTVDAQGFIHIVWTGGNVLYYSQAYAPEAGAAQGWSYPMAVIGNVPVGEPAIASDSSSGLYALWTQGNEGLEFTRSEDGSRTWLSPQNIFETRHNSEVARWGQIAVDDRGRLHVTLTHTVVSPGVPETADTPYYLYYLRSEDKGATWSEPLLMAPEPSFGQITVATFGEDVVHVVWNGRAWRKGRYHRWSKDGGQTWSSTDEAMSVEYGGGLTGVPALAVDANGVLHMVSTGSVGNYYLRWQDGAWTQPLKISGDLDGNGVTGTRGSSLEQPSITLSEGNQLHVVFHDGFERIWYVGSRTDAPRQDVAPLPVAQAAPTATGTSSPAAQLSPQPQPASGPALSDTPPASSSTVAPMLLGILPAALLVVGVMLYHRMQRPR